MMVQKRRQKKLGISGKDLVIPSRQLQFFRLVERNNDHVSLCALAQPLGHERVGSHPYHKQ
jgi:hypothetical protein